jgi:sugar transferase (PEP-CTERM system associated)
MMTEGVLILLCLFTAAKLRFWYDPEALGAYVDSTSFVFQALTVLVVVQLCFYYNELYNLSERISRREEIIRLGQALGAACLLLGVLYFLFPMLLVGKGVLLIAMVLVLTCVTLTRFGLEWIWQLTVPMSKVAIVGGGTLAAAVTDAMSRRADLGFELAGKIATTQPTTRSDDAGRTEGIALGHIDNLTEIVRKNNISRIVVALEDSRGALPVRDLVRLRVQGVEVEDAHTALAALTGRVWLDAVRPSWFVFSDGFRRSSLTTIVKRAIDLASSIVGLALSAPVMAAVAIAVRLDSKGPIFYKQTRVGLGEKPFELLKFRSMRADAESVSGAQWAAESDPRATRVGSFLRKYRLDELPQFINVLRGDMSLVGPRPERPVFVQQLREQIPFYDERHSVRPGVTGWAQVEYKYGSSIKDAYHKLEYDLFYLKNLSIMFDVVIMFRTVGIVLFGGGR